MLLLPTIALITVAFSVTGRYENWSIVEVQIDSPKTLELLRNAGARSLACFDHAGKTPMLLDDAAMQLANKLQIQFRIIETDIDQRLENFERQRERARNRGLGGWYSDYKTWTEVNVHIEELASGAPEIATTFLVGTTHEGRDIRGIRITAPGDSTDRLRVLFNGCQHAREWVAVMVPVYVAEELINGWYSDPETQSLLTSTEVIIVPIVNPDGYAYTYAPNGDRFWRKNRRNNPGSCEGVDLNRNWDLDWNGGDSTSTSTCSDIYVGPSVFSEPETQAMRDLINTLPNLVSHIDFHSYSQLVLEPWASTYDPHPRDPVLKALSGAMTEAIASVHGEVYLAGGGELLYNADGTFEDWSTSTGALGYTIELRPNGSPGFDLPPEEIVPTCEENFAAIMEMLRFVNQPALFLFPDGLPSFLQEGELFEFPLVIESVINEPIDTGSAVLHVRYGDDGMFALRPMAYSGNNTYTAELPASLCGLESEYWFSVDMLDGQTVRYPEGDAVLTSGISTQLYSWNMDVNPNWTTQGLWSWGTPTGGGGQYGNPDPTSGATGNSVLGYNLNGDYENNLPQTHLTSEQLDFSNDQNIHLKFKRYLNVEQPTWDHASISVRSGNGPWTTIWTNPTVIQDNQWQSVSYDISGIADLQQNVTVRWTMGATDSAWRYSGWNLDDIQFVTTSGSGLLGDVNCDGDVNITDLLAVVAMWGECVDVCNEDIVPDGTIDVSDLLLVIGSW